MKLILAVFITLFSTVAQAQQGCVQTFDQNGWSVTKCPPRGGFSRQMDGGGQEYIPVCNPGYAFNRESQSCIPATQQGGVIPCSQDDVIMTPRGPMPRCRNVR